MVRASKRSRRLWDTYWFPGFRPEPTVRGIFGDPKARVIILKRRSKKRLAGAVGACRWAGTLRQGEAGTARLSGGQSALHQALCVLCGPALSGGDNQGGGG